MVKYRLADFSAVVQGVYYGITGIWPILSRGTFEAITGPKVDFWLVRTTGAIIASIGVILAMAGLRQKVTLEIGLLGVGAALSLGGSDVIYSSKKRIPKIYMLESIAEFGLLGLWMAVGLFSNPKK